MALKINIPFFAFRVQFFASARMTIPMADAEVMLMGETLPLAALRYAESLQRNLINQGDFKNLLEDSRQGPYYKANINIHFPAAADGMRFPAFQLDFDYFFQPIGKGAWAVVPALSLELFVADAESLEQQLSEAIRLEFTRKRRLSLVQRIVSAIWMEQIELQHHSVELLIPSPREVETLTENAGAELLPKVAQVLSPKGRQLFGHKSELQQLTAITKDRFNRNALLVGPSGVGKTTLVWEIARRMLKKAEPTKIWETTASILIKELVKDTDWQDNIAFLCKELSAKGDFLFVRSLMELFEVGRSVGNEVSVAEYLRTFISRGEINLIVECTEEELARIELQSPHFAALFRMVRVAVPQEAELEKIIRQKTASAAKSLGFPISEGAVSELIRLSRRFNPYSGMPGKPIRFLESLLLAHSQKMEGRTPILERTDIVRAFCEESGLPIFMIDQSIPLQLGHIEAFFKRNLFGQEKAVGEVINLMASVKTALNKSGKPIASLLFVGPTGVGKTEMAKLLAEFMFGHRDRLVRFDMSEFSDFFAVSRLIGAEGLLTSAIRRTPFSVVLFDEIEKADSSFFDLLLQILSEGRLTDGKGLTVNFCSSIIIMTSNLGAQKLQQPLIQLGNARNDDHADLEYRFVREVQQFFRPELYNRIDQVIPFTPLDASIFRAIVEREIDLAMQREGIRFRRMSLKLSDEVIDYLAKIGYDPLYGARHLQRVIRKDLAIPLAIELNSREAFENIDVFVKIDKGKPAVFINPDPLGLELLIEELEKDNFATIAAFHRKRWQSLAEGHLYISSMNELSLLEKQRLDQKSSFWHNEVAVKKYHILQRLQHKGEQLKSRIEQLENTICLACLGVEKYRPDTGEHLNNWKQQWDEYTLELLSRMEPKLNYCHLGIYGPHFQEVLDFYLALFNRKGWKYSAQAIWFRESHYNESTWEWTSSKAVPNTDDSGAYVKQKREAYLKTPAIPEQLPAPPKAGDLLCGIEIAISGICAFPFLKEEGGIQRWTDEFNREHLSLIELHNDAFSTPNKIHRQDSFRQQAPRRVLTKTHIKDTLLKINREYKKSEAFELILDSLEQKFVKFIQEVII